MLIAASVATALVAARTDARERTIPNWCCALLAGLGLAFQLARALLPGLVRSLWWEREVAALLPAPFTCVVTAAVVLVVGVVAELCHRHLSGRVGMGLGDVKFLAAWATLIGPAVLLVLAASCLGGAVFALVRSERDFALGPWIFGFSCALLAVPLFAALIPLVANV